MSMRHANARWYLSGSEKFGILPSIASSDGRLSAADFRVLLALASFANENGVCWPRRATLSKLTGISMTNISRATTRLMVFGWLSKRQIGETSKYWLQVPSGIAM